MQQLSRTNNAMYSAGIRLIIEPERERERGLGGGRGGKRINQNTANDGNELRNVEKREENPSNI